MVLIPSSHSQPPSPASRPPLAKSALDRVVAALLLLLTSLCLLLIALAIWVTQDGPVLDGDRCVGRNGRPFSLLRFRTSRGRRPDDSSAVGRLVRATDLDVLPELINLLRGDLSLVGPRPRRTTDFRTALHPAVRPGLIPPWNPATPPRSDAEEERAVQVYLQQWSPWRDLRLAWDAVRGAGLRAG